METSGKRLSSKTNLSIFLKISLPNTGVGVVFGDLSKAFDCVPHNLLIAKLATCSVDAKQCICINNVHNSFQNVFSGVPQGSIVSLILFNCFYNDFFYFIDKASEHNFADDNSLSAFESNIKNLKLIVESESKNAI